MLASQQLSYNEGECRLHPQAEYWQARLQLSLLGTCFRFIRLPRIWMVVDFYYTGSYFQGCPNSPAIHVQRDTSLAWAFLQ